MLIIFSTKTGFICTSSKELFGDLDAFASDSYLRFDTFAWSTLQCFLVIIGEDWSRIMYFTMIKVGGWTSFYFLAEVLIGRMIVLNLLLAVVLSNDSIGVTMRDDKMRIHLVSVYEKIMTRAAFKRWKYGQHDPHLYETLEMIKAQEEGNARPRILNSTIYGNSLKELEGTRKRRNSWLQALHQVPPPPRRRRRRPPPPPLPPTNRPTDWTADRPTD